MKFLGAGAAVLGALVLSSFGCDDASATSTSTASGAGGGGGGDSAAANPPGCVAQVSSAWTHTCAVTSQGTLWCWGENTSSQLGDGTKTGDSCGETQVCRPSPTRVDALPVTPGGALVTAVSSGFSNTCALTSDGALWCWGANTYGQVGNGSEEPIVSSPVQIDVGVAEVSVGFSHACARRTNGSVACWGTSGNGELGLGSLQGANTPTAVTKLGNDVVMISAGEVHTCALRADGSVWCWGDNAVGEVGDGTTKGGACGGGPPVCHASPVQVTALGQGVAQIVSGNSHSCARKSDGSLWCWGDNRQGQVGDGTAEMIQPAPVQVISLGNDVASVSAGIEHTCAIKTDGSLWCWGFGFGPAPLRVTDLAASVSAVSGGGGHTCVTKTKGSLWCFGANGLGQAGIGTFGSVFSPALVPVPCE